MTAADEMALLETETNEELSRRHGFTYTDHHRRLQMAVLKLVQRKASPERPSLTLIRGGLEEKGGKS